MSHPIDFQRAKHLLSTRRKLLSDRHAKVQHDLARASDPLVADSADRAIQLENDQALEAIDDAAVNEITAIDAALLRIDRGQYGICAACHRPIEPLRLTTVPHAATCARCAG